MSDDRRASARQRTYLQGYVYYNNRSAAADCLVRDLSDRGAKLLLSENVVIPDLIDLYIPKKAETFRARVQWRHGNEVGVAYVDPKNGRAADQGVDHGAGNIEVPAERGRDGFELADRVERLEAEVVSLKRTIRSLVDEVKKSSLRLPL
jgi:hypothetical protein